AAEGRLVGEMRPERRVYPVTLGVVILQLDQPAGAAELLAGVNADKLLLGRLAVRDRDEQLLHAECRIVIGRETEPLRVEGVRAGRGSGGCSAGEVGGPVSRRHPVPGGIGVGKSAIENHDRTSKVLGWAGRERSPAAGDGGLIGSPGAGARVRGIRDRPAPARGWR